MQKAFDLIVERLEEENDDVIVKDTYSKGKNAGLRKAKIIVNQVAEEYKHVTTCYLQSPCEYQNEDIRIDENSGWIPCSKPPLIEDDYIICFNNGYRTIATYTEDNFWNGGLIIEPTAWRPLPAPYKQEVE